MVEVKIIPGSPPVGVVVRGDPEMVVGTVVAIDPDGTVRAITGHKSMVTYVDPRKPINDVEEDGTVYSICVEQHLYDRFVFSRATFNSNISRAQVKEEFNQTVDACRNYAGRFKVELFERTLDGDSDRLLDQATGVGTG